MRDKAVVRNKRANGVTGGRQWLVHGAEECALHAVWGDDDDICQSGESRRVDARKHQLRSTETKRGGAGRAWNVGI